MLTLLIALLTSKGHVASCRREATLLLWGVSPWVAPWCCLRGVSPWVPPWGGPALRGVPSCGLLVRVRCCCSRGVLGGVSWGGAGVWRGLLGVCGLLVRSSWLCWVACGRCSSSLLHAHLACEAHFGVRHDDAFTQGSVLPWSVPAVLLTL
jgi:hypothetical protein